MQDIEQVYKEYFETVYKYLLCLTHNKDTAEELTQETFCRAVKNVGKFKGNCKISVWLCQIAKNLWYDECRKRKDIYIKEDSELEDIPDISSLEEIAISNNEKNILNEKLKQLDSQTKEVILLRITGDLSFKEIANILDKTENWARVTFYRGKQKIMKEVHKYGDKKGV